MLFEEYTFDKANNVSIIKPRTMEQLGFSNFCINLFKLPE
jgi:hypothetical protein